MHRIRYSLDKLLRQRMLERMEQVGLNLTELSKLTGDSYRSVQNWMSGTQIPASFLVRYVEQVPVSVEWLLTGKGLPEPVLETTAQRVYSLVARVMDTAEKAPALLEQAEALFDEMVMPFFETPNGAGSDGDVP